MNTLVLSSKRLTLTLCILVLTLAGCAATSPPEVKDASLYQRLGGYDAVAAVVDDFIGKMVADDQLKHHFAHLDKPGAMRTRQLIVDMVCNATGGPCYYTGRDMVTTHTGMGITEAEWNSAAAHLGETLTSFKVPEKEQQELFAIVGSLKPDIVGH